MRYVFSILALFLIASPAAAQQKYSSWSDPAGGGSDTGTDTTRELVDKLNALIDEAEKSRAADPVFLRDLRDLARGYMTPLKTQVLMDNFADGDFSANPAWTVSAGRYWIEKGWGLRSAITPQAQSQPQQETKKADGKDLAFAILGAVLKQANKGSESTSTSSTPPTSNVAAIHSAAAIANAFALEMEIYSGQAKGQIDIGPYQGTNTASGYRLTYLPGGTFTLTRNSSRGTSVVQQAASLVPLEDQKTHIVSWTRDKVGQMEVSVDGKVILSAADRGFSDPFDGVTIANRGGDYIIKNISVSNIN